jgi:hypothetical protein
MYQTMVMERPLIIGQWYLSSYNNAAYLHDWLYNGGYYEWTISPYSSTRTMCLI